MTVISDLEVQEYLNHINLQEGTVDYNVFQQVVLLDKDVFVSVLQLMLKDFKSNIPITDITQVFRRVAQLPHINNTTVKFLTDSITDNTSIKKLKTHFIETGSTVLTEPGHPILDIYRKAKLIPFTEYAAKKYQDYTNLLLTPNIQDQTQIKQSTYHRYDQIDELVTTYITVVNNSDVLNRYRLQLETIQSSNYTHLITAIYDFTDKLQFINTTLQDKTYLDNNNFIGMVIRDLYKEDAISPGLIEQIKKSIIQKSITNNYRSQDGLDSMLSDSANFWKTNPIHKDFQNSTIRIAALRIFWYKYYRDYLNYASPIWNNNDLIKYNQLIEFCNVAHLYLHSLKEIAHRLVVEGPI